jgi:hypothetical protein
MGVHREHADLISAAGNFGYPIKLAIPLKRHKFEKTT